MTASAAAAWICALALGSPWVETDARLTVRSRELRQEGAARTDTTELEALPRLAVGRTGRLALSAEYAPRLTLPFEISGGAVQPVAAPGTSGGELLHRVEAVADAAATPNLTLRGVASGAYGQMGLLRSEVYANEALPTAGRITWRSARATIAATATPSRTTTETLELGAFDAGGADAASRATVPLQQGVRAAAALRRALGRRDEAGVLGDAMWARITPPVGAEQAAIARLGAAWTRQATPDLSVRAATGAAWTWQQTLNGRDRQTIDPFLEATLSHAPPRGPVRTDLGLRVTPYLSPLASGLEQRLEASGAWTWRAARFWELGARIDAGLTRSETSAVGFWAEARRAETVTAAARASWAWARHGTLSFGPHARWQRGHVPEYPSFVQWGGYVELAFGGRFPEREPRLPSAL